jgi:hypothetical protein
MEQYLDQKDEKWHITFWFDMPRVIIKNKLNFRIKEIVLEDGSLVSDPKINNSKYIFPIPESILGRNVFFNFNFSPEEISKISEFKIGLCDERVRWFNETIIILKNNFLKEITINKTDHIELPGPIEVASDTELIEVIESKNLSEEVFHANIVSEEPIQIVEDEGLNFYNSKSEIIPAKIVATKNLNKKKYKKSK